MIHNITLLSQSFLHLLQNILSFIVGAPRTRHVSDSCMIEHLRSITSKTISTDGSLSLIGQGTFGWMLTDANKGQQLITGSGPVDGPATQASYTRSELHGFAAPLEYIHQLSRY